MDTDITIQEMVSELGLQKGKNKGEYTEYYCPIHDNKTPDLAVYGDDFCCFSSSENEGGGPISLMMHVEQIDSKERAIEWIQEHFPEKTFEELDEEEINRREKAREVLNRSAEIASQHLKKEHQNLYDYIKQDRNFDDETMEETEIGFMSRDIISTLEQRFDEQALIDSGLFFKKDGELICQMYQRIVFPYSRGDQVWYMIGRKPSDYSSPEPYRLMLENSNAKYKKLKTSDYNKHILYEWHKDNENADTVIITEGVTDAISAHVAGYNVSSPVTTRYADKDIEHVCNQTKHFDTVYIAMDGDDEGRKGARKTAHQLAQHGIEAQIVDFDEGDLDDYTTENGYDIEGRLDEASFYMDVLVSEYDDAHRTKKSEKKQRVWDAIKSWVDEDRNQVFKQFSNKNEAKKEFKSWCDREHITPGEPVSTEQTEQTEPTERGTHKQDTISSGVSEENNHLKELAQQNATRKKRLAGKVDGTYFLTAWIEDEGLERPAIITSNDNISYIKHKLKEKQRQLGEDQELTNEQKEKYDFWYAKVNGETVKFQHEIPKKSKQAINNLDNQILKYVTGIKECRSGEEIFDDARELISDYWSHYHDEWFDVTVAYNFHTFLLPVTGYTVYILLNGRPQTGKTTWQKVNSMLNYNGCFAGNLTPATAVRYAHSYFATLHQDEMEKQSDERKNQMQGLYNTGQRKGGVYNITNTEAGNNVADQIQEIQSFCAKSMSVNNVFGFADSFMSRNVILKTVKTKEKGLLDPDSMSDEQYERFRDLQAEMAYYVLKNHEELLDSIEQVREDISDTARDEDKMAMFKGLVQHFKGEERADVVEERIRDSQRMQEVSKVGERVTTLFEDVSSEFKTEDSKIVQLRASDMAENINDELGLSEDAEYRATSKSVVKMLKEYDVLRRSDQKKKDSSGYTAVEIQLNEFLDACDRYELSSIYEDLVTGSSSSVDSGDNDGEEGDKETHTRKSGSGSGSRPQSAQSAQSAQVSNIKAPSTSQIKRKIREWQEDDEKDTKHGVDVSELEEYFVEAYSDHEKVRRQFEKQPDKRGKKKTGVASLWNEGKAYEPKPGKIMLT